MFRDNSAMSEDIRHVIVTGKNILSRKSRDSFIVDTKFPNVSFILRDRVLNGLDINVGDGLQVKIVGEDPVLILRHKRNVYQNINHLTFCTKALVTGSGIETEVQDENYKLRITDNTRIYTPFNGSQDVYFKIFAPKGTKTVVIQAIGRQSANSENNTVQRGRPEQQRFQQNAQGGQPIRHRSKSKPANRTQQSFDMNAATSRPTAPKSIIRQRSKSAVRLRTQNSSNDGLSAPVPNQMSTSRSMNVMASSQDYSFNNSRQSTNAYESPPPYSATVNYPFLMNEEAGFITNSPTHKIVGLVVAETFAKVQMWIPPSYQGIGLRHLSVYREEFRFTEPTEVKLGQFIQFEVKQNEIEEVIDNPLNTVVAHNPCVQKAADHNVNIHVVQDKIVASKINVAPLKVVGGKAELPFFGVVRDPKNELQTGVTYKSIGVHKLTNEDCDWEVRKITPMGVVGSNAQSPSLANQIEAREAWKRLRDYFRLRYDLDKNNINDINTITELFDKLLSQRN